MPTHQTKPTDLSAQAWKRALLQTKDAIQNKDLSMFAAGVAYFATFAFFPAVAAFISIYALSVSPHAVLSTSHKLAEHLPSSLASLVTTQVSSLAHGGKKTLIGAIVAIILALFSASSGVQNLIKALNHAYDATERRKGLRLRLISFGFTLGLMAVGFVVLGLLLLQPSYLMHLGIGHAAALVLSAVRWVLLIVIITVVLAVIYRYAPDRREPRWSLVSWGGAAATLIWLLGTVLFFIYVQYFSSFNKTYGIFAGLVVLMSWLNLSSFIILLGAEVNHRLEIETNPTKRAGLLRRWLGQW